MVTGLPKMLTACPDYIVGSTARTLGISGSAFRVKCGNCDLEAGSLLLKCQIPVSR
jgi:hypothetical protein